MVGCTQNISNRVVAFIQVWRCWVKHWNWSDPQHLPWFCHHPFFHLFTIIRLMPWAFLFWSIYLDHVGLLGTCNSGRELSGPRQSTLLCSPPSSAERAISGVIFLSKTHYVSDRPLSAPDELLSRYWIRVQSENSTVACVKNKYPGVRVTKCLVLLLQQKTWVSSSDVLSGHLKKCTHSCLLKLRHWSLVYTFTAGHYNVTLCYALKACFTYWPEAAGKFMYYRLLKPGLWLKEAIIRNPGDGKWIKCNSKKDQKHWQRYTDPIKLFNKAFILMLHSWCSGAPCWLAASH